MTAVPRTPAATLWLSRSVRELGRVDRERIPDTVERLRIILRQRGCTFDDLGDLIERVGVGADRPELEHDAPISYAAIKSLFDLHKAAIANSDLLWLGSLLRRLRQHEQPTIQDRRNVLDLRARLRNGCDVIASAIGGTP